VEIEVGFFAALDARDGEFASSPAIPLWEKSLLDCPAIPNRNLCIPPRQ